MTDADLLCENGMLRKRVEELERRREAEDKAIIAAEWALQPFSDCVHNDNGDATVTNWSSVSPDRFIDAHFAYKRIRALKTTPPEVTRPWTRSDVWQAMIDDATEGKP